MKKLIRILSDLSDMMKIGMRLSSDISTITLPPIKPATPPKSLKKKTVVVTTSQSKLEIVWPSSNFTFDELCEANPTKTKDELLREIGSRMKK